MKMDYEVFFTRVTTYSVVVQDIENEEEAERVAVKELEDYEEQFMVEDKWEDPIINELEPF